MSKCVFCFIYYNCVTVSLCHDKGNVFLYNKFTSICILETSEMFEKIIYNYLIEFMDHNDILYSYQFGFRKDTIL